MTDYASLRITRTAPAIPGLTSPKYWLRMEQDLEADLVTQGEVAEMLDELYDIDPCIVVEDEQQDAEPEEAETPPIEELYKTAKEVFGGNLLACQTALAGDYTAVIKIYRSHLDETYKLVLSAGEVIETVPTQEERIDTIPVSGATSVELEYPVAGSIAAGWLGPVIGEAGIIAAPEIKRQGNLLYWDATATGTVRAEYTTEYDRVTVEIPGVPASPGSDVGDSQAAKVLAFYHFMVFQAEISKPDEDNTVTPGDLKQLCGYNKTGQFPVADDEDEPLPEPPPPPEYGCRDYGWGLADPAAYEAFCCVKQAPPTACLLRAERNPGGNGLSQETINRYLAINKNTEFIPVTPRGAEGCGTTYYHLRVKPKQCCDEVEPLAWDYNSNPDLLPAGQSVALYVLGGKSPYTWRTSNGSTRFSNNKKEIVTLTPVATLYADVDFCGGTMVTITDGCTKVGEAIRSDLGHWELLGIASYDYDNDMQHSGWGTPCVLGGWALGSQEFGVGEFASDATREFDIVAGVYRQIERFTGYYRLPRKCYDPATACTSIQIQLQTTTPPNTHFCMSMNAVWKNGACGRTDYGIRGYSGYCYLGPVEFGNDFATYGMASQYQAGYKWSCP